MTTDHATKAKADHATHLARVRAEIRPAVEFQPEETDHCLTTQSDGRSTEAQ